MTAESGGNSVSPSDKLGVYRVDKHNSTPHLFNTAEQNRSDQIRAEQSNIDHSVNF